MPRKETRQVKPKSNKKISKKVAKSDQSDASPKAGRANSATSWKSKIAKAKTTPPSSPAALAELARKKHEETGDLRYLCLHYHYHAENLKKLYESKGAWADLARFFRLKSHYYACAATVSNDFYLICEKHRFIALYWQLCSANTNRRLYRVGYYQAMKDYYHALSQIVQDPIYLRAESYFNTKYEECKGKTIKEKAR
jgi:hypothetical protein